ncbi:MAG: hypothetical protein AAB512_04050 [Patescibacteria group bacterium]
MEQNSQIQLQNQQTELNTKKGFSIILSFPYFILAAIAFLILLSTIDGVGPGKGLLQLLLLIATMSIFLCACGILLKKSWAGITGLILNILLICLSVYGIIWSLWIINYEATHQSTIGEEWGAVAGIIFIVAGLISLFVTLLTTRHLWRLWYSHTQAYAENSSGTGYALKQTQTEISLPFAIINFVFIIFSEIISTFAILSLSRFGSYVFRHLFDYFDGALVLIVASNLLFFFFNKSAGDDPEKSLLFLKQIRKVLFYSLIVVIPFWVILMYAGQFGDGGTRSIDSFSGTGTLITLPPYILLTALFTIPMLIALLKSKKVKKEDSASSPTKSSSTPNPDPRFPTLDAQPKLQNNPQDNQNQG